MNLPRKSSESLQNAQEGKVLNLFPDSAAKILKLMMLIAVLGFLTAWTYGYINGLTDDLRPSVAIGITILMVSYREFRANRIQRGLIVLCWSMWGYAATFGILVAGIRTPILIVIPCLIMTIAWIQGKRPMFLMLGFSVLLFCVLTVCEIYHWLPAPHPRTPIQVLITFIAVVLLAGVVALVLAENFKRLIEKGWRLTTELQQRVRELKTSEQALKELNEQLELRVHERTSQYDEANKDLQKIVSKLELAQVELVNAEKLASLGSMVAGISHELNTPIGNVLTLTTSMENHYQTLLDKSLSGKVRRSEFNEFLKTGLEMSVLATRSTTRAVELVSSFKQVAVDQTSEQRRSFNLREVIEDNIATLWPSVKKRSASLRIDNQVPEHIICDSFPGPLGQVIINLTQNAILHGLVDDNEQGLITIKAEEQANMIHVSVTDNGIGMPPSILAHIFDPFFTTKLGKGGSGLGLSISYRIVTSVLGGNISVISSTGQGAQFNLLFPRTAPFKL